MGAFLHWLHDVVSSAGFQWVSFSVGVIGAAVATYAWLESRKKDRVRDYLFELAEKNLDKQVTEKQLEERRREVKEASDRIEALQKKIEREIPLEAKRTVLKDRLALNIAALHQALASVRGLKQDLEALGSAADMPPDLLKSVEHEISPEYVNSARRESLKTYLTIVMTASAVVGSVIPFSEMRSLIQLPLLMIGGLILLALARVSIPKRGTKEHRTMLKVLGVSIALAGALISSFFGVLGYLVRREDRLTSVGMTFTSLFVFAATIATLIFIWRKQRPISSKLSPEEDKRAAPKGGP